MNPSFVQDPLLSQLRGELAGLYGSKIERIVLFGSRARGEATDDSDYDVAVFLRDMTDRALEFDRLADLHLKLMAETGVFFDIFPFPEGAYHERTPIMHEIRLDGVDL